MEHGNNLYRNFAPDIVAQIITYLFPILSVNFLYFAIQVNKAPEQEGIHFYKWDLNKSID